MAELFSVASCINHSLKLPLIFWRHIINLQSCLRHFRLKGGDKPEFTFFFARHEYRLVDSQVRSGQVYYSAEV